MPNDLPKQLYICRFTLKCGAVFDVVTEQTREQIVESIANAGKFVANGEHQVSRLPVVVSGVNPEKNWPVDAVLYDEVACLIHAPFQQWLAARPNLSIQ